jgi:hypothetical protein
MTDAKPLSSCHSQNSPSGAAFCGIHERRTMSFSHERWPDETPNRRRARPETGANILGTGVIEVLVLFSFGAMFSP